MTYPILRFKDSPEGDAVVVQRTGATVRPAAGEPPTVPSPAAIANAFFDATGVRIRQTPMTPARVRAALKAAGVKPGQQLGPGRQGPGRNPSPGPAFRQATIASWSVRGSR